MKILIVVLIICSFLQSTIIPVDLNLIILICRSYTRSDKSNLFLAFAFGLLNSYLNLNLLGLQSLIYLVLVSFTQTLSKSRLAGNLLLIMPLVLFSSAVNQVTLSIAGNYSIELFPKIFLESFISLPSLYLIRLWEERFIVKREIKLRV